MFVCALSPNNRRMTLHHGLEGLAEVSRHVAQGTTVLPRQLAQLLQLGIGQQAGGALYLCLFPASHQSDSVTAGSSSRCTNKSAYRRMGDVK